MTDPTPPTPLAKTLLRGQKQRPGRAALISSIVLHGALVAAVPIAAITSRKEEPMARFQTFRISMASPPPQVAGEPVPVPPKPAIARQPKPPEVTPNKKAPVVRPTPAPETKPATPKKPAPTTGKNPKPNSPGGDGLNVLMEGEEFPFPGYLENVIRQVDRYFRPLGEGNLETEVGFYIRRDGSVSGLRILKRSGNTLFDIKAVEAVEQAAKRGLLGELPKEYPRDSLGILFKFVPPR
ncbi:MAG: TonB C-terminal domain-containing protein [Gemmatimonadota bacterium]